MSQRLSINVMKKAAKEIKKIKPDLDALNTVVSNKEEKIDLIEKELG